MRRADLIANLLTLIVLPTPAAAAPVTVPATPQLADRERPDPARAVVVRPSPSPSPSPAPQIALGALQLVTGAAAGIGGTLGLMEVGINPKQLGIRGDFANLAFVGLIWPTLAGAAVCGTGYLSSAYRGRCATTFLGAYVGAALGIVLGFALAPSPGPDDTAEFSKAMAGIAGVALLSPVGAVAGWHLGKQEVAPPQSLPGPLVGFRW